MVGTCHVVKRTNKIFELFVFHICILILGRGNHSECAFFHPDLPKNDRERSSMATNMLPKGNVSNLLPAQKKALQLIIVVVNVVCVREQRRDTYYRYDPKKYGLNTQ